MQGNGVVQGQGSVDDAVLDLTPVGHFGQKGPFQSGGHVRIDQLDRGQGSHLGPGKAQAPQDVYGILGDLGFLPQIRRDIHGPVGHEEQAAPALNFKSGDVAQEAPRPQSFFFVQHRPKNIGGAHFALHDQVSLAFGDQGHGLAGRQDRVFFGY